MFSLLVSLSLGMVPAVACGPDFPTRLLEDRAGTLLTLPEGTFAHEVARLLPAPDRPMPVGAGDRREQEAVGLTAEQIAQVEAMRASADPAAAMRIGEGLPEELRLYTAGAVAYHARDPELALERFEAVLALPSAERRLRGTWARYMVGQLSLSSEAQGHYARLRSEVAAGAADPAGLAVASLGEEARTMLSDETMTEGIALYAEQAAYGSWSGAVSLLTVARELAGNSDDEALARWVADPLARRLLVAYAWTRPREIGSGPGAVTPERLIAAIEAAGVGEVAGADRLAALAYNNGRYDLAARYASAVRTPLSAWVRAKLALRSGDEAAAASAYAEALAALRSSEPWPVWSLDRWGGETIRTHSDQRIEAELGVLQLSRGAYVDALRTLLGAVERESWWVPEGWEDAAYVAERVLTTDELIAFLRAEGEGLREDLRPRLRSLLARRLMRDGRAAEAAAWFDDPELAAAARAYADAIARTERRDAVSRAGAWLDAAAIARPGLFLFGTEGAPDHVVFEGSYIRAWGASEDALGPAGDGSLCEPSEAERVAASAASPDVRFHYREQAADHAEAAAALLPRDSQAFAVALCRAATYVRYRDEERYQALYRRYLREGPLYPGSERFGDVCPEPDLDGARARAWEQRMVALRPVGLGLGLTAAGLAVLGVAVGWIRRRA